MQKNDCSQPMYSNTMTMAGTSYTDSGTVKLIAVNEKKTQKKIVNSLNNMDAMHSNIL